jgi:chromosome segregation ATPase
VCEEKQAARLHEVLNPLASLMQHKEEAETLRQTLRRVELRATDLVSELGAAREEKEQILALYSQTAQELARARQSSSVRGDKEARGLLAQAEAERDECVRRWQDACKAREKLQTEVAALQSELGSQQTRLGVRADAGKLAQLQAERDSLASAVAGLRVTVDGLEEKVASLEGALNGKEMDVARAEEDAQQVRLLLEQVDRSQEERNEHHTHQAQRIHALEAALKRAENRAAASEVCGVGVVWQRWASREVCVFSQNDVG